MSSKRTFLSSIIRKFLCSRHVEKKEVGGGEKIDQGLEVERIKGAGGRGRNLDLCRQYCTFPPEFAEKKIYKNWLPVLTLGNDQNEIGGRVICSLSNCEDSSNAQIDVRRTYCV